MITNYPHPCDLLRIEHKIVFKLPSSVCQLLSIHIFSACFNEDLVQISHYFLALYLAGEREGELYSIFEDYSVFKDDFHIFFWLLLFL